MTTALLFLFPVIMIPSYVSSSVTVEVERSAVARAEAEVFYLKGAQILI